MLHSLLISTFLKLLHPMVPPCIFSIDHAIVVHKSIFCGVFWIFCVFIHPPIFPVSFSSALSPSIFLP
jgi:hypothetical protein